jgi:hypothetical protein
VGVGAGLCHQFGLLTGVGAMVGRGFGVLVAVGFGVGCLVGLGVGAAVITG